MDDVTYKILVKVNFTDMFNGKTIISGSIFETSDPKRALNIIRQNLGELLEVEHKNRTGKKILIHQNFCYKIGGIETANRELAQAFKDKDITFIFGTADQEQMIELGKYASVILDKNENHYDCDVLIMSNYDSAEHILPRTTAKKVYQHIHADFDNLTKMKVWSSFMWQPDERVDKVLAVSETAKKGLKTRFNVDSEVVPNILLPPQKRLVFVVLSRASAEKGIDRVLELANRMEQAGKEFVIYIASTLDQLRNKNDLLAQKRIVPVEPSVYNVDLLNGATYLLQLSLNESYCYSVHEALARQVPCITSRIPEFEKLIKDGVNGYILNDDFSNLDIDKIFDHIPKPKPYNEKISPLWEKVMNGEL